jgi:long-chain acyl-CoA synthetase
MAIDLNQTLVSVFAARVARDGESNALLHRPGESFEFVTWNQLADDVVRTAAALAGIGVTPGDRVVQVSENRYEWIVVDLAIHALGAVHVAVHSTLTGGQIAYQIADCGATVVIVSCDSQAEMLASPADLLPSGLRYFSHDFCNVAMGGATVEQLGKIAGDVVYNAALLATAAARRKPDDLATILYTSGTTGEPKGVMLSHRNLASNALATLEAFPAVEDDLRLCWLPLSHIYARTSDCYTWLGGRGTLALAKSRETILADCQAVRPTLINGVPYFYDKICRHLTDSGKANEPGAQ